MRLTVIPGDGIGPEVMSAVIEILQTVRAPFEFDFQDAGEVALRKYGELLPTSTLTSINKSKLVIKGPTTTPAGGDHKSISDLLQQKFDLYANVRPVKSLPAIRCAKDPVDLTIVRENTVESITGKSFERIARYGYELAKKTGRKKIAIAHKANPMKMTDNLFLNTCLAVGKDYPKISTQDIIIANCSKQLTTKPEQFEVIITENIYGDILSALCVDLVGGLGIAPSANIGPDVAIFETLHGSAQDIAGQNKANPTALLQSVVMLLQHIGENQKAETILKALMSTLQDKTNCTEDLGGQSNTQLYTKAIIQKLTSECEYSVF